VFIFVIKKQKIAKKDRKTIDSAKKREKPEKPEKTCPACLMDRSPYPRPCVHTLIAHVH
jgi:hypothetical protein